MKRSTLLVATLLLTACGSAANAPDEQREARVEVTGVAKDALLRLAAQTGTPWSVLRHPLLGTAAHLEGRAPAALPPGADGYAAAVAFLREHKEVFSMQAPELELRLTRVASDETGTRHVRMQQLASGLRVVDAEVMAHFDAEGALVAVDARYVPGLASMDLRPTMDGSAAQALAKADALAGRSLPTDVSEPELVVFAPGTQAPRLVYSVRVRVGADLPELRVYAIDARSGAVVNQYDDLQTMTGTGKGVKGDTKTLQVSQQGGSYSLVDKSRTPSGITTYTAGGGQTTPGSLVTSPSSASWDTNAGGAPGSAVDAHYNAGVVYDYYKTAHGRAGIDGNDGAIVSTVHFSQSYDNAFWDGTQMVYGDGDGAQFYGFAAGLDVVGHELTHGVTQYSSALTYQDQSGALNEAVSDIMGCMVEHFGKPDPTNNWLLGEAIGPSPTRDLVHPSRGQQPSHMSQFVSTSQDNGGVHVNSGIVNNAGYLMTMGGTNDKSNVKVAYGVGWEKAGKLWYLTNTQYLMSGASFADAAQATLTAAKSLAFTQNEQNIVECAWIAVGVLSGACKTLTPPVPPPSADAGAPQSDAGATAVNGTGTNGSADRAAPPAASASNNAAPTLPSSAPTDMNSTAGSGCSVALGTVGSGERAPLPLGLGVGLALLGAAALRRRQRVTS